MRFCFIIEARYRNESMPMVIADQLLRWGHEVDLLERSTVHAPSAWYATRQLPQLLPSLKGYLSLSLISWLIHIYCGRFLSGIIRSW